MNDAALLGFKLLAAKLDLQAATGGGAGSRLGRRFAYQCKRKGKLTTLVLAAFIPDCTGNHAVGLSICGGSGRSKHAGVGLFIPDLLHIGKGQLQHFTVLIVTNLQGIRL